MRVRYLHTSNLGWRFLLAGEWVSVPVDKSVPVPVDRVKEAIDGNENRNFHLGYFSDTSDQTESQLLATWQTIIRG